MTRADSRGAMLPRIAGGALAFVLLLPLYRTLRVPETGLAGDATAAAADVAWDFLWSGALLSLAVTLLAALLVPAAVVERALLRVRRALLHSTPTRFALLAAVVAAALTLAYTVRVLDGVPNHIDALAQLLHARVWASGQAAAPVEQLEFWMIQNSVITSRGWVSQYPPGHVLLLAVGLLVGAPALVGALLAGLATYCTARFAALAYPGSAAARAGVVLLALSPFVIGLAGSFMSHITVAACAAGAAWALAAARARNGYCPLIAAGLALGFGFAVRPLSALAAAAALVPAILGLRRSVEPRALGAFAAGAALPVLGLLAYNAYFFGAPFRFGYDVALGPGAGLGFGTDPWGNLYGPAQAAAFTAADLVTLNMHLLESPLPLLLVIAAWLLRGPVLEWGTRALLAWACIAVLANALYWHHGQLMGPRMLLESAPAWLLLAALATAELARALPEGLRRAPRFALRAGFTAAAAVSVLAGLLLFAPQRLAAYGGDWLSVTRTPLPRVAEPSLVFVHDAWRARVAMRLAGQGMRLDSVEIAVRSNPTCLVQQLADARSAGDAAAAARLQQGMRFTPGTSALPPLVEIGPGNRAVILPGEALTPACRREIAADRLGVLDLAPLAWRGALPGAEDGIRFVRDLGPEQNADLLRAHPARSSYVYLAGPGIAMPRLVAYDSAMSLLWGATGAPTID